GHSTQGDSASLFASVGTSQDPLHGYRDERSMTIAPAGDVTETRATRARALVTLRA
ncbi:MAG: hypothetical protein QOJ23_3267, partial [Actinomycetota bacterium]|nr:hypothetical protein [Actinomycetota bacterium]